MVGEPHIPFDNVPRKQRTIRWFAVAALAALGFVVYANSFPNRAMFHHDPNVFSEPLLDDTVLKCPELLPVIFSNKFFLTTYGHYRPLGYSLFALINSCMPVGSYAAWRVVLIGLHVLSGLLVFGIVRRLLDVRFALGLAAAYLVHPAFVPLINDVNVIYFLWGLLFSALAVWLYVLYVKSDNAWWLPLSILAYVGCLLTYGHAVVVLALLMIIGLFHKDYPRVTVAMLVVATVGAFLAGAARVPVPATSGVIAVLAAGTAAGASVGKQRFLSVAKALPPFVVAAAVVLAYSRGIFVPRVLASALNELRETGLQDPFQLWHVSRFMMATSRVYVACIALAGLLPLALLVRSNWRRYVLLGVIVFLFATTVSLNQVYLDDVTYWTHREAAEPDNLPYKVNLGAAYLARERWEEARDSLLYVIVRTGNTKDLLPQTAFPLLGCAYDGIGKTKVAGNLFFYTAMDMFTKPLNNRLRRCAEFCFRLGYLSYAEHYWACALVIAPYDIELNNNLGRVLIYKNFFRAAEKYFQKVLRYDSDNVTALYHLAFVEQTLHDDRAYSKYCRRWKEVTGSQADPDFSPLFRRYAGYQHTRDKMRKWFSGDPRRLKRRREESGASRTARLYSENEVYEFSETDIEFGDYHVRTGNYVVAADHYRVAHRTNPRAKETLRKLMEVYRQLNNPDAVRHYESILKKISDEE